MKRWWFTLAMLAVPSIAVAQESELATLRAAGRDPSAVLRLGRALRRAGHFEEAWRTLQPIARSGPLRTDAQWEAARVRFDQGVFRPAQAACGAVMPPQRRVCMARAYLVWNRVGLADRELAALAGALANDGELQLVTGDARRLAADVPASERAYQSAASALPGRDDPYLGLGTLYELVQRFDDAAVQYRRAVEVDATDPLAAMALGRFLLLRRANAREALPLLERANRDRPDWAEALGFLGEAQLATGSAEPALASFRRAVQLSPTQPGGQSGIGRALVALGRWADAEAPIRTAISQVDNDIAARMALADVLEHTARETEAMTGWDAVIDRAPQNLTARLRAAQLAHRTQQNTLARTYLERVLEATPPAPEALFLRGEIARDDGDRPAARGFFQRALPGAAGDTRAAIERALLELDQPVRQRRR